MSNGLAVFGAFLLAASLLAGVGEPSGTAQQADANAPPAVVQTGGAGDAPLPANRNTRKFRVNLFLFRH